MAKSTNKNNNKISGERIAIVVLAVVALGFGISTAVLAPKAKSAEEQRYLDFYPSLLKANLIGQSAIDSTKDRHCNYDLGEYGVSDDGTETPWMIYSVKCYKLVKGDGTNEGDYEEEPSYRIRTFMQQSDRGYASLNERL